MSRNRKSSWMGKSLIVGLALILLLPVLPSTGMADGPERTQPGPGLPFDLDSEPTLADQSFQAIQQGGAFNSRLPFNRVFHSTIYDEANDRIILFGGFNGRAYFNDVWALSLPSSGSGAWTKISPDSILPAPRGQHTAIYDSDSQRMIVFGGHSSYYNWDDVWALSLTPGSETWTQIVPAGSGPGARRWHTAIYDQANDQMVVFGGSGRGGLKNDVWTLSLSPGSETWSQLAVTGSVPAARAQHTAIYSDTAQGLMVVFGGATTGALLDDTWALNLTTGAWNQIAQVGLHPSARRGHTAIYNSVGIPLRMEIMGGQGSDGFLNDRWALQIEPGPIHWYPLDNLGTSPSARAWHASVFSAAYPYRTTVLGGRGTEQSNGAQWALDMSTSTWSPITPTLPSWGGMGTFQAMEVQTDNSPQVTQEIEDALPNTVVNLLSSSEVWLVTRLKSPSSTYANNITVTLSVNSAKFTVTAVGTRHKDADNPTWGTLVNLGGGRYRIQNVSLTRLSGESDYRTSVVFKATVEPSAAEGSTTITAEAKGTNWSTTLGDSASARIYRDPQAWIITNRTLLFDKYDDGQVANLLDEVFEQAQGAGHNGNPTAVVLYADRYVPSLKTWDNRNVSYASETAANTVADAVADWLVNWATYSNPYPVFAYPEYMVILGDDNIIPFYRKHDYGADGDHGDQSEDDYPNCWGNEVVCDNLVSHNYFMTDNPYGDQEYGAVRQNWEYGDLEASVGRIVGISAADMQYFLENSVRGPNASTSRAIIASDGLDWWVTGADNDAQNILELSLGYTANESLIDANPTKTDVVNEMTSGFAVAALAHHGETYVWSAPGGGGSGWSSGDIFSNEFPQYDPQNKMPTNRPFFYFNACRVGYSYTNGWGAPNYYDDSMVYALVHRGVSGIVASAGLSYGVFDNNALGPNETLSNNFWKQAKAYPDRSDPLGWSLKQAKVEHPVDEDITEKKTVQTFTYFGVPWMRLPGHGSALADAAVAPQAELPAIAWSAPMLIQSSGYAPSAIQATYVVTAHVNASGYTTSTIPGGFNLIEIPNFTQRLQEGQPVLPRATMELILPLSATITSVVFTPTQPVTLTDLNIPTLLTGVPIPGGSSGGYTTTVAGTYPATVTLTLHNMDGYRVARLNVSPAGYNAAADVARLYQSIDLQVQYDTPRTLALTYYTVNKLRYLPGDPITVTASVYNAGGAAETVTPTLQIIDAQGQITDTTGAPLVIPAGESYDLNMSWTGYLDGDAYMTRLLLEQGGEVVAGAGREVFVTEGAIQSVTGPEMLMPGQTGVFTVTFENYAAVTTTVMASLSIYDMQGDLATFLDPQTAFIPAGSSGTMVFSWTADRLGPFVASTVVVAGGQEYGPVSFTTNEPRHVFLPIMLKN